MTASYNSLVPGQVYHIRLLVADAKDGAYDSVVYLESGSFTTDTGSLPVEFLSFTGECSLRGNQLNWQTTSEANNDHFILEKSSDGINFVQQATILGSGNSQSIQNYTYMHSGFVEDTIYYRLSQVDFNGKLVVLKIIAVVNDCAESRPSIISSYNAINNSIDLHTKGLEGAYTIRLYNSLGEVIYFGETSNLTANDRFSIQLDTFVATGIYSIHLSRGAEYFIDKLLTL